MSGIKSDDEQYYFQEITHFQKKFIFNHNILLNFIYFPFLFFKECTKCIIKFLTF